jgi:hypothetical protein
MLNFVLLCAILQLLFCDHSRKRKDEGAEKCLFFKNSSVLITDSTAGHIFEKKILFDIIVGNQMFLLLSSTANSLPSTAASKPTTTFRTLELTTLEVAMGVCWKSQP